MSDPSADTRNASVEISIIVPCRNEAENVLELADRARAMFEAHGINGEVVFINDASTDHTGALIDDLAARHPFVRAVHHPQNRGIPGGWESGLRASRGRYVAIMDGDLQYLPEDVYRLYRELKYTNADIVQGWRSHIGRARDFRYTMSRVLHWMLRLLFGVRLFDIKSGFLVCDRDVFAHILRRRFSYYYFQTFIVVSAHHKGYRIEEIESLFEERKLGESFISAFPLKMILKNLVDLAVGFIEFRLMPLRTDVLSDFLARHPIARRPEPLPWPRRLYLRGFAALMPLHHWKLSPTTLRYYYQLRRTQWLNPEQIRELQEARLRALIKHAYRHVSYYRERFDRLGIDPDTIQQLDDLPRLPVLSKADIRRNLHFDLLSDAHVKLQMLPIDTCGSTGEPLTLYTDRTQLEMRWAAAMRNLEWTGFRFGNPQLQLRHAADTPPSRWQAWRERLDALLTRRAVVRVGAMTTDAIREHVARLRHARPAVLSGDTEVLDLFARYLERYPLTDHGPKAVISSEQTLSPAARTRIEQALRTTVFDKYASREFSGIAHECERHDGHHVNAESYIVEVVRDGQPVGPGEIGEVLVTDLSNLSVPLIRYAIGDRARLSTDPCPCGRGLPLIRDIHGRGESILVGANGEFVPGIFFSHVLKDCGHVVRQFRVVQEERGVIDFHLVKGPRFSRVLLDRIVARFHQELGADFTIRVHETDRIEPAATGEPGPSVSKLPLTAELFGSS